MLKIIRRLRDNFQLFAGRWVGEGKGIRVEERARCFVWAVGTVEPVAENRVAGIGKVDPNLMGSTSDQPAKNDGEMVFEPGQNLDLGLGGFPFVVTLEPPCVASIDSSTTAKPSARASGMTSS